MPVLRFKDSTTSLLNCKILCMADTSRYSTLPDGRVLDSEPMSEGKGILVFDKGAWVPAGITLGEWRDSKPLTAEEAAALTGLETLPQ